MALEPAGVSLQAEGFRQYIKRLDEIEKKQREAFEAEFKGTSKSYAEVTRAAKAYEKQLDDTVKAEQKAARQAEKAAKKRIDAAKKVRLEQEKLAEAAKTARATQQQAFISAGTVVLDFAQKIGTVVVESGKLAAQFEGQSIGLDNLAASFGQSGNAIQSAIQKASKGTISGLQAIEIANTALLLGVAKTPAEFEKITKVATTLGRALGLSSERAIERFTVGLGRQSKLIIDDLGISTSALDAEIERIAQRDFGKLNKGLTQAQKASVFTAAALSLGEEKIKAIGDEAGKAQASFERLTASSENLKVTFGTLAQPLGAGISKTLTKAAKTAQQFFAFLGAGFSGIGTIATGVFGNVVSFFKGEATRSIDDILDEAGQIAIDRFKEIASTIEGVSFPDENAKKFTSAIEDQSQAVEEATINIEAYQVALQQAESLQLSFARAAEDSALKLARANEDIARKQQKAVSDLGERQKKDRDKLLRSQIKQLEKFDADRKKQITKAESDIAKERKEAGEQRKRDQKKLQQDLLREQEKFNLSQLQSERRFNLQETRLRAEGDIIGLKELREDFALSQQEEKENFGLSKKEQVSSGKEQLKEQKRADENRINELKSGLESQRAELLASFDEQLKSQQAAQIEARNEQRRGFEEAAAERQIALAREEEDRRISQARQLEDLGRSLAEQEGVTAEGTAAIANQLEKVFGIDGTADSIISGFAAKTKNEFTTLFDDLEKIVSEAELEPKPISIGTTGQGLGGGGGFGARLGGLSEFDHGGVVDGPGPVGSPQVIQAHKGETFLPTHRQSFQMAAPIIPSQNLNVNMGGEFKITGNGQGDEKILQAAAAEVTENFRIAVERIARRN